MNEDRLPSWAIEIADVLVAHFGHLPIGQFSSKVTDFLNGRADQVGEVEILTAITAAYKQRHKDRSQLH